MPAGATRPCAHDIVHCEHGDGTLEKGLAGVGEDVEDSVVESADAEGWVPCEGRGEHARAEKMGDLPSHVPMKVGRM